MNIKLVAIIVLLCVISTEARLIRSVNGPATITKNNAVPPALKHFQKFSVVYSAIKAHTAYSHLGHP